MARRYIHYEAAFEDYIRSRGWPYVPVDEQKKAIFAGARVKSFDFLVYGPAGEAWLVDIKGRKFPYDVKGGRRYWENWVTQDDLDGLSRWKTVFGASFEPALVFAYWLLGSEDEAPPGDIHAFRGRCYSFLWVSAATYAEHARVRSPKWNTVAMPTRDFKRLVRPMSVSREGAA